LKKKGMHCELFDSGWERYDEVGKTSVTSTAPGPPLDPIDTHLVNNLGKLPFESAWSIAQTLNTSHSVVLQHLHEVLVFKSFHLGCVPEFLTGDLRFKRKQVTREMIPSLKLPPGMDGNIS
jgi:hypothetical protein